MKIKRSIICLLLCFLFASPALARVWTSVDGQYSIEATFVSLDDDMVTLKKSDGKSVPVSIKKLSVKDRKFVRAEILRSRLDQYESYSLYVAEGHVGSGAIRQVSFSGEDRGKVSLEGDPLGVVYDSRRKSLVVAMPHPRALVVCIASDGVPKAFLLHGKVVSPSGLALRSDGVVVACGKHDQLWLYRDGEKPEQLQVGLNDDRKPTTFSLDYTYTGNLVFSHGPHGTMFHGAAIDASLERPLWRGGSVAAFSAEVTSRLSDCWLATLPAYPGKRSRYAKNGETAAGIAVMNGMEFQYVIPYPAGYKPYFAQPDWEHPYQGGPIACLPGKTSLAIVALRDEQTAISFHVVDVDQKISAWLPFPWEELPSRIKGRYAIQDIFIAPKMPWPTPKQ